MIVLRLFVYKTLKFEDVGHIERCYTYLVMGGICVFRLDLPV
jgi:hypothetical protein